MLLGCLAMVAALSMLAILLDAWLPLPIDPALSPAAAGGPRLVGNPIILGGQLVGMVLLIGAGVGFARRAVAERDELMSWLAGGAILAVLAGLNYFLFPSPHSDYSYIGDFFVLAFHLVLLVGAARQIHVYHRDLVEMAVLEQRRRIARDLHDGLAQDLAFIVSQSQGRGATDRIDQLASAAERALDDSRAAIAALRALPTSRWMRHSRGPRMTSPTGSARVCACVSSPMSKRRRRCAKRCFGSPARRSRMRRARRADRRRLALARGRPEDDRRRRRFGFDPGSPPRRRGGGFGLISMRERAEALDGALAVSSTAGRGTTVEVVVPCQAA